jgi:hypothetical protein
MKHYERELFVSRVRSGAYFIEYDGIRLKIVTPTIEGEMELNEAYNIAYESAIEDDFMTEDENLKWMDSRGLWTGEDEDTIKTVEKDLEKLKVEIFNNRNQAGLREQIRKYIRAAEKKLSEESNRKNVFIQNTCEGVATVARSYEYIKTCTFYGGEKYDFNRLSMEFVLSLFQRKLLTEKQTREIAREEPWRSLWALRDTNCIQLFSQKDRELSVDQKNLLVWSKMYENIQESMDCPTDDVIEDDDLLDGWFIVQRKKRDKERAESEFENDTKNEKIKNSGEIFVMASDRKEAKRVESLNDINGDMVRKQRLKTVRSKGKAVSDLDFQDVKLTMQDKSNQMFKDNFRGR